MALKLFQKAGRNQFQRDEREDRARTPFTQFSFPMMNGSCQNFLELIPSEEEVGEGGKLPGGAKMGEEVRREE